MREILPNRRDNETFSFHHGSFDYKVTTGYDRNDTPKELFINSNKAGSEADVIASDAAIAISLALQYGCPLEILRQAMKRNSDGTPMGPLAHALDLIR